MQINSSLSGMLSAPLVKMMKSVVGSLFISFILVLNMVGCGKGFEVRQGDGVAEFITKQKQESQEQTQKEEDSNHEILEKNQNAPLPPQYERVGEDFVRFKPEKPIAERFFFTNDTEIEEQAAQPFRRVKGGLSVTELKHELDKTTQRMRIAGVLNFVVDKEIKKIPFVMSGVLNKNAEVKNTIDLTVENGSPELKENLKGTIFCEDDNCDVFGTEFLYLASNKTLYQEKVSSAKMLIPREVVDKKTEPVPPKEESDTQSPPPPQAPSEEDVDDTEDAPEEASESPEDTQEPRNNERPPEYVTTAFVGSSDDDIIKKFTVLQEEKKKVEAKVKEQREKTKPPAPAPGKPPEKPPVQPPKPQQPVPAPQPLPPSENRPLTDILPLGLDPRPYAEDLLKILRPLTVQVNQASGTPDSGKLTNGINLVPIWQSLEPLSGFRIMQPTRGITFGTSELVSLIVKIGQWMNQNVPNFKIDVRNMSKEKGGKVVKGQSSHQLGIDADIGYIFQETNNTEIMQKVSDAKGRVRPDFRVDKQWELFKDLFRSDKVLFVLVSKPIRQALCKHVLSTQELVHPDTANFTKKALSRISDRYEPSVHDNHFHIRVKCGPQHKLCHPYDIQPADPCTKIK